MTAKTLARRVRGYDVYEAGHPIRRLLPSREVSMIGPIVLLDHFGPARVPPGQGVVIAPHGHAHLATLTYFFSGASLHEDDLGNHVVVRAGDVAWMHAGSGIVHSERTPDEWRARGGVGHGIQAWVALPEDLEMSRPRFQVRRSDEIPEVNSGGATLRILVGETRGARSPIETCSPVFFVEARTGAEAAEISLDPPDGARAALFVAGSGVLDEDEVEAGTLVVMPDGATPVLRLGPHTIVVLLGGAYLGRRYLEGNFIASSEARLDAALRRYA